MEEHGQGEPQRLLTGREGHQPCWATVKVTMLDPENSWRAARGQFRTGRPKSLSPGVPASGRCGCRATASPGAALGACGAELTCWSVCSHPAAPLPPALSAARAGASPAFSAPPRPLPRSPHLRPPGEAPSATDEQPGCLMDPAGGRGQSGRSLRGAWGGRQPALLLSVPVWGASGMGGGAPGPSPLPGSACRPLRAEGQASPQE